MIDTNAVAAPRHEPGEANPVWGKGIITHTEVEQYGVHEFSAGMGTNGEGIKVALGETPFGSSPDRTISLTVKFFEPMAGMQEASGSISVKQALAFEESVRAVFEAARARGFLPAASRSRQAKRGRVS